MRAVEAMGAEGVWAHILHTSGRVFYFFPSVGFPVTFLQCGKKYPRKVSCMEAKNPIGVSGVTRDREGFPSGRQVQNGLRAEKYTLRLKCI